MTDYGSIGIGIDLGGTTFTVGVFTQSGEALSHASHDTPTCGDPDRIARTLAQAAEDEMRMGVTPVSKM